MKAQHLLLIPALLTALACGPGKTKEARGGAQPGFSKYSSEEGLFKTQVPSEWKSGSGAPGGGTAESSTDFAGPTDLMGGRSWIAVTYYGPDHPRMTMARFMELNSKMDPYLHLDGEVYGPVKDVTVAGRAAKTFDRKTFDFVPPYAVNSVKVPVYERFTVVPGINGGFYTIALHTPEDLADQLIPKYEKVVAGFSPDK